MNFTNTRYYEILGVTHDASLANIENAKDRLKYGSGDDRAPFSEWALIDEAYAVLSDVYRRREYDNFLRENGINQDTIRTSQEFMESRGIFDDNIASDQYFEAESVAPIENEAQVVSSTETVSETEEPSIEPESIQKSTPAIDFNDTSLAQTIADDIVSKETPEVKPASDLAPSQTQETEEKEENKDLENEPETINRASFVTPFAPVSLKFKDLPLNEKFKTAGKYAAGTLVVFSLCAILPQLQMFAAAGAVVTAGVWLLKHKSKVKLHKDKKVKKITQIKMAELEEFNAYEKNLDAQINKLLSEPHNNYKLQVEQKRYEAQIELLKKILEIRKNRHAKNSLDLFKNKLEIMTVANRLEEALKKYNDISNKIENYDRDKTPRLAKLNNKLIDKNIEISEKSKANKFVKKLKMQQKSLNFKRDKKGTLIKKKVVRSGKFYDAIAAGKARFSTGISAFAPWETVQKHIDDIEEKANVR